MTKGNFTPLSTEEGATGQKSQARKRVLMIALVVLIAVVILAIIIGVVAYFLLRSPSSPSPPGMEYQPQVQDMTVFFEQGLPENYNNYTDRLEEYLSKYENENQAGEHMMDCSYDGNPDKYNKDKACVFRLDNLGAECVWQRDFGYHEGQPCVLLELAKVMDWEPDNITAELPADVKARYQPGNIPFSCEGMNYADKENLGAVRYYPDAGVPYYYFPYLGQENYRNPLVFAKFMNPKPGVLIMIECKAWVANRVASVAFNMMVD